MGIVDRLNKMVDEQFIVFAFGSAYLFFGSIIGFVGALGVPVMFITGLIAIGLGSALVTVSLLWNKLR